MIIDPVEARPADLKFLQDRAVPVVLSGLDRDDATVDCAGVDDMEAACDAVEHLLELGHTDVAMITGPLKQRRMNHRPDGYRKALAGRGLAYREELVANGDYSQASGYACAMELLDRGGKFTALFAANDLMAIGAMMAVQEKGLRVPEDLAMIGFDNIPESAVTTPRLSTVDNPHYTQGRVTAEMLFERINGEFTGDPRAVVLPHRLIVRGSTGRAKSGS
jgi:LacI family transcriptional regulator